MALPATQIVLRDFNPSTDYPQVVALHNAVFGMAFPVDEEVLARRDREWAEAGNFARRVAVAVPPGTRAAPLAGSASEPDVPQPDMIVGHAAYIQAPAPNAERFYVQVLVQAAWRRQGIGSQLYGWLPAQVQALGARRLQASAQVDQADDLRFFAKRGYVESFRESNSVLDVAACDLSPYADLAAAVAADGITLRTWAELDPDESLLQAFFQLEWDLLHQVAGWEEKEPPPFATWRERRSPGRGFLPEAYLVALDGDKPVGVTFLVQRSVPGLLHQGLTGVLPTYRRRHIALALKVQNVRYAQAHGYTQIVTSNAVGNAGMLRLNARLGFVPHPTRAMLVCELD